MVAMRLKTCKNLDFPLTTKMKWVYVMRNTLLANATSKEIERQTNQKI